MFCYENALVGSQSKSWRYNYLRTILLVLIYKQNMVVQPIGVPPRGYKTGRYVTELNYQQSMYLREQELSKPYKPA